MHTHILLVTTSDLPTTASIHTTILYSSTMESMTLPTPTLSVLLSTASPSSTPFPETNTTVVIVCVALVIIAGLVCGEILALVLTVKKYRVGEEDVSNEVSTELEVQTQYPQSGEEFLAIYLVVVVVSIW